MDFTISELITISGFVGAGIWFFWTQKFEPRIEFDIDCKFFFPAEESEDIIAEIRLILNNKGFVQHTLRKLELSVHALDNVENIEEKPNTKDVIFKERILERQTIVPSDWYYWVRPGVNQVITKTLKVNKMHSIIQATAGFTYGGLIKGKHTARRVFEVSSPSDINA